MDSLYLSSEQPRIPLAKEADIRTALDEGLLEESHYLDLKRELALGKGANRETARDLASFAPDSGTLLIGIEEAEDGTLNLCPQPLHKLAERIEQIAYMIPDPPLAVVSRLIPSEADPEIGYAVVHVPASPSAPHMVDGKYLGRGDKTKRYLTDAEVLKFHLTRADQQVTGTMLVEAEIQRDIFDEEDRQQAHMFLVAEPVMSRPDLLLQYTDSDSYHQWLFDLRQKAGAAVNPDLAPVGAAQFSPGLNEMGQFDRRPRAVALSTYGIAPGRLRRRNENGSDRESAAELEVYDNGGLRLYSSRLSESLKDGSRVVFDAAAVGLLRQLLALAGEVGDAGGYFGNWTIGFGATGIKGMTSYRMSQNWLGSESGVYGEDKYVASAVVSYAELQTTPGTVAGKILLPFLRPFRSHRVFEPALSDIAKTDITSE